MRQKLISICIIGILALGVCGCAQTDEDTLAAEKENAGVVYEAVVTDEEESVRRVTEAETAAEDVSSDDDVYFPEKQEQIPNASNGQCVLEQTGENEYEITLYDKEHNLVFSEVYSYMRMPPWVKMITDTVWEIGISVGSPARYTFYFDTETAEISDTFFNAKLFGDKYIAYMENDMDGAGTRTLTLTDIFCDGILHQEIVRDFSALVADPMSTVTNIEMIGDKTIRLEYFEGEEMTQVSETIELALRF